MTCGEGEMVTIIRRSDCHPYHTFPTRPSTDDLPPGVLDSATPSSQAFKVKRHFH